VEFVGGGGGNYLRHLFGYYVEERQIKEMGMRAGERVRRYSSP